MAETLQAGLVPVAHTFLHPNEPEYRDVEARIVRYDFDVEPVLVGNRLVNVAAAKTADATPVWNVERWDVR